MTSSCPQVLSLQHSGSDSSHAQFAAYWKPVLSMDANSWQRWLHMHRLVLILEHDTWVSLVGPQPGWRSRAREGRGVTGREAVDESVPTWPRKAPAILALLLLSLQTLRQGLEERSSSLSPSPTPGPGPADLTAHPLPGPSPSTCTPRAATAATALSSAGSRTPR